MISICGILRKTVAVQLFHDLPVSNGHLSFEATFDKIRNRCWWPTMPKYVAQHMAQRLSCQHRKTYHRPLKLPAGHRLNIRPFRCVVVDLVEFKSSSNDNK